MSRSTKKSITVPNPIREGLQVQLKQGTLDYPSENAAWIGLVRYQLLSGKPHPITSAIARMHPDDQDVIDDFLLDVAKRGLTLKGQFLSHLIREALTRTLEARAGRTPAQPSPRPGGIARPAAQAVA